MTPYSKMNKRAKRARKALVALYQDPYDTEAMVRDMLADLRHLCDARDIDFAEQDGIGYRNYLAERAA